MKELKVSVLTEVSINNLHHLVEESKEEGFRFLERMISEYIAGKNRFDRHGEILLGIFEEERLIAIGGLNQDPYNHGESLGRLRRVYVLRDYRKKGVARLLCSELQEFAKKYYKGVILHTDTSEGDLFYRALGYQKTDNYQKSSHYLTL